MMRWLKGKFMDLSFVGGGTVFVNGVSYKGNTVSIKNGVVTIDGVRQDGSLQQGPVNVVVSGDVQSLSAVNNVTINGDCGDVDTISGDIYCGNVDGNVESVSGNVFAQIIHGKVKTISGDIRG